MPSKITVTSARFALFALLTGTAAACSNEEVSYQPKPAPTVKAGLPSVPTLAQRPIKNGDAYTVWGASYHLRSRVHNKSIAGKEITLVGYITKTNLGDAPECAVHEQGKEDPDGCKPPVPTFWLADAKDAGVKDSMKVMGWASNYANIYDAIEEYEKREKSKSDEEEEPLMDGFWGVALPNPLPVKGAKVRIKGYYSTTFTKATNGAEVDPVMGIMTYGEMKHEEKASELATLPGMK